MKVAFVVIAVFLALVVYVSAQEVASNQFLRKYKNIRKKIRIVAKLQNVPNVMKSWKDRKSCYPDDLAMLPQRLLDWFHVLKNIDLRQGDIAYDQEFTQKISQNVGCTSPALVWFFKKFDANKDLVLNRNELAEIESIPYEHCIKQFFQRCDVNNDRQLSLDETCHCFAEPPCSKVLKEIRAYKKKNGKSPIRMYEPQCDEDGFYMPRQCNVYGCRCVDRFNQAIEGTSAAKPGDCPDNTDPNEVLFTGDEEDEE